MSTSTVVSTSRRRVDAAQIRVVVEVAPAGGDDVALAGDLPAGDVPAHPVTVPPLQPGVGLGAHGPVDLRIGVGMDVPGDEARRNRGVSQGADRDVGDVVDDAAAVLPRLCGGRAHVRGRHEPPDPVTDQRHDLVDVGGGTGRRGADPIELGHEGVGGTDPVLLVDELAVPVKVFGSGRPSRSTRRARPGRRCPRSRSRRRSADRGAR